GRGPRRAVVRAELDPYREPALPVLSRDLAGSGPRLGPRALATLRDPVLPLWRRPGPARLPVVAHPPRGVGPAGPARVLRRRARHRFRPRAAPARVGPVAAPSRRRAAVRRFS